jgi:16S rRNA (guanine527-N7)-methyltransferase
VAIMQGFDQLPAEASKYLAVTISQEQNAVLSKYADLVVEWNKKFNLTAIRDPEEIRIKHFLDSLSCVLAIGDEPVPSLIDIGTGAGFPGLPLKILYPETQLTLVESVVKKTHFLSHTVQELDLNRVEVVTARAEIVGYQARHREKYDWAVARAVANLPVLCEYLLPLVKVGGYILAQKGESALLELQEAQYAIKLLGGRHEKTIPVRLPGIPEERYLLVIQKTSLTPEKYPRREGIPAKRPLLEN